MGEKRKKAEMAATEASLQGDTMISQIDMHGLDLYLFGSTNHPEHNDPLRGSTDQSILTEPLACRLQFSMFLGVDWEGEDRSTWHRWFGPILGYVHCLTHEKKITVKEACIFYWPFSTWHGSVLILVLGISSVRRFMRA